MSLLDHPLNPPAVVGCLSRLLSIDPSDGGGGSPSPDRPGRSGRATFRGYPMRPPYTSCAHSNGGSYGGGERVVAVTRGFPFAIVVRDGEHWICLMRERRRTAAVVVPIFCQETKRTSSLAAAAALDGFSESISAADFCPESAILLEPVCRIESYLPNEAEGEGGESVPIRQEDVAVVGASVLGRADTGQQEVPVLCVRVRGRSCQTTPGETTNILLLRLFSWERVAVIPAATSFVALMGTDDLQSLRQCGSATNESSRQNLVYVVTK